MSSHWTERTANPKAHIERDDGRICLYKERVFRPMSRTDLRRVERLVTSCKEEIAPRQVSGATYYPKTTEAHLTCLACIAERENPRPKLPSLQPYRPF